MALTKQQKELITLGVLGLAGVSLWYGYLRPSGPGQVSAGIRSYTPIKAENFGKVIGDLEKAQKTEYKSAGRNIFVMGPIQTQTAAGPEKPKKIFVIYNQPQPSPPPPPAELPAGWVFFGYGTLPAGGSRQAFLKEPGDGSDPLHIVSEGDVLLDHIRILHIGNERIDFEDTNTHQKGSKALETPPQA